ncbi:MAG TPA: ubiquinol-cytochrome c reductase iron-sulfur subunit [Fimbriimonadaceae bacterium]|nr:ubiquinol-cytochrome c reductase iron-sulfur subunit [Fimbriimonadaceae bacterium]
MNNADQNSVRDPERRRLLGWMIALFNIVVGIAIIGPVIGFIGAPLEQKLKGKWIDVLGDDELGEGETKETRFTMEIKDGFRKTDRTYVIFLGRRNGAVVAFNPSCTHLGCRVKYQDEKKRFFCPCHGGVFDVNGKVVAGPPPRPLDRFETKVENGRILVRKEV